MSDFDTKTMHRPREGGRATRALRNRSGKRELGLVGAWGYRVLEEDEKGPLLVSVAQMGASTVWRRVGPNEFVLEEVKP